MQHTHVAPLFPIVFIQRNDDAARVRSLDVFRAVIIIEKIWIAARTTEEATFAMLGPSSARTKLYALFQIVAACMAAGEAIRKDTKAVQLPGINVFKTLVIADRALNAMRTLQKATHVIVQSPSASGKLRALCQIAVTLYRS